ncbi:arylamine N-acetyltransferase [Cohnella sp. CFH 77786]|uniref:arylamine N-acetyltransferase family protein n=1 Tax=Cohnella sp. CFH 77786 TaxID=2662265 RepID=UPI001C60994D|nr:arylamine N-acetyltransferase [Cohnella sp. CFH 77786]MBW5446547.1 arylamine N-acetyltransferase [Cohnella sp. CFH 77786]
MLTNDEIKAYLRRIGIPDRQPPTLPYLIELHQAHVRNVPWQTVDIFAGKPVSIDLKASVQLLLSGRSGYCFHLNGAFSELLRSLGYRVSWHRAGVQPLGEEPRINSFHLGMTVNMENERGEEESWIADVGLGDMPYEPLPLRAGNYEQGPLRYAVTESRVVQNGWRLVHDPQASFAGVDYDPEVLPSLEEFKPKHEHYSRSPESPWIDLFLVRHRHAGGSNELRGCVWSNRDGNGTRKTEIQTKTRWFEVLGDVFGETLANYSRLERDDLWKKARSKHEEWKRVKS